MKLPVMNVIRRKTEAINRFGGLDQRPKPYESCFTAMKNMTCERLPVMAARRPRMRVRTLREPGGLFAHEKLCWVDGTAFYYDGIKKGTVTAGEKNFVRMGAYVLIWPDGAYYNSATDEFGSLDRTNNVKTGVTAALCKLDGEPYAYTVSRTAPEDPKSGECWMDESQTPNVLKMWNANKGMWVSIQTVYTKITAIGIGKGLKANDAVELSGFSGLSELNGSFDLVDAADNFVMVTLLISKAYSQTGDVTVSRRMPKMDFVTEAGNRVWGCSNEKHEIYASALGDPTNWKRFGGLDSDSYAVTVGTAGDFTGAASHLGNALFFKENVVHQIMGTKPSNFSMSTNTCRGVAKGSENSLCHVNEYLMYKAALDVCMMGTGTLPSTVSEMLGKEQYKNATAGALGSRYFISMEDEEGQKGLFVYDTTNSAWCREDGICVTHFAQLNGELYMLTQEGEIWSVNATAPDELQDETCAVERTVEWEMITGEIGLEQPYTKYISGIQLHMACEPGTALRVDVQYDTEQNWKEIFRLNPVKTRSLTIPFRPGRCKTLKIRIRGEGTFELYSISRTIEQGSDVYAVK